MVFVTAVWAVAQVQVPPPSSPVAKEVGALTIGVVPKPFTFEALNACSC